MILRSLSLYFLYDLDVSTTFLCFHGVFVCLILFLRSKRSYLHYFSEQNAMYNVAHPNGGQGDFSTDRVSDALKEVNTWLLLKKNTIFPCVLIVMT